jgi:hypothetical protein
VPTFPGSPVSDKETDCDDPLVRIRETVPLEVPPACTIPEPGETLIEKPNGDETIMTNVAVNVTGLLGILNVHVALEQDTPIWVDQPENCDPEFGVAVTVIEDPTASEQPFGQFGLIEPLPEATLVLRI